MIKTAFEAVYIVEGWPCYCHLPAARRLRGRDYVLQTGLSVG